jgi:hypothetical protein
MLSGLIQPPLSDLVQISACGLLLMCRDATPPSQHIGVIVNVEITRNFSNSKEALLIIYNDVFNNYNVSSKLFYFLNNQCKLG